MTTPRHQVIALLVAIALVLVMIFAFDTKPPKLKQQEQTRALNQQVTSIDILRQEAMEGLDGSQRSAIQILRGELDRAPDTLASIESYKKLSSKWYELGSYSMAGYYAEQVALSQNDAQSWSIAGTTYGIGSSRSAIDKERTYCRDKAIESLDKAIAEEPENVSYQLNKGVILAENPLKGNPMKGVLILINLNKKFPENVPVMNNLAKFALQTGQTDRAMVRLTTALELEPNNRMSNCLMAELYSKTGDAQKAAQFAQRCEELK